MGDLKYGMRMLWKRPGFTLVAVCSLALGIGANTTVFCWIQNTLLRPFPGVKEPAELVMLCTSRGAAQWDGVSYPDLQDYGGLTQVFAGVIGSQITPACLSAGGRNEWAFGQIATANFFDVLGVKPLLGRTFLSEEEQKPGGHPILVLNESYWRRRFGGDPGIIGRTVELNRRSFTVVGVVPAEFRGTVSGLAMDFWAPVMMHEEVAHFGSLRARNDRWLHTQARLRPGVSLAQAQAAVETLARQLDRAYPDTNKEVSLRVLPPYKSPYGGQVAFLPVLRILFAVSIGVLLIVAANVANLLLARATTREKEIAIRLAMGAGRGRLVRQLLTESLLLALVGGAAGVLLASWAARLLLFLIPTTYLPIGYTFNLDWGTLGFTLGLTLLTGLVFGLVPAWQSARLSLQGALKEGGRGSAAGARHHRLRGALVAAEIALALLLLISAGLCIKGFRNARRIDPGFEPRHLLLAGLRVGAHGYTEETAKVFYRQLRERLAGQAGVTAVALASWFPLGFEGGANVTLRPEGYQPAPGEDLSVPYAIVTPGYFETMRIGLVTGRDFTEQDDLKSQRVVILNETAARRFWPGQNPLGRKLTGRGQEATVIGVVKDGKYRALNEPPRPFMYLSYQQGVWDLNLGVAVRTIGNPLELATTLRREVRALDTGVEVWALISGEDFTQAAFLPQRMATVLLVILGAVAVALAVIGIYGVMAYDVNQRTHEIGVRMALGAKVTDVICLVLGKGLTLAALGTAAGLAGAIALTRLLASFLYGVSPFDFATFGGITLSLGLVSLLACYIPARRAASVDPMVALRYE